MKTLTIALPDKDYEFLKCAFEELAKEVLTADERGQRDSGRSVLFRMICTASIVNFNETAELLRQIKNIAAGLQPAKEN